jgi:peptidoglycan/LPS O-acetylase OafA/YrhL
MFYCWKLVPDAFFASRGALYSALALFLISLAIFFRFDYTDISLYCGPLSVFECSVAVMILWLVSGPRAILHTLLEAKPMIWIGNISYALYLWHYAVFEFAKGTFRWPGLQIGFAIAISFVIASASYYLIEKPFLKLKDRMQLDLSKTAGK